ncbi:hypothetical protein HAX54_042558 [Datura stramonium]|uniref:Pectinesterase inhibitor domain-containing protein n=1 Tax=Datura stramonium TaxID=4076 RepID=A0ABS8W3E6_DATST|nr:hypothetical protein [Datura stramonium]
MAPLTQTFLVIAISLFLTIPSNNALVNVPLKTPQPVSNVNVPAVVEATLADSMTKTRDFIQNVIAKRLAVPTTLDHFTKDCLETCKEVYGNAIDSMKKATQNVKENNFYKANVDLSAVYSFLETCSDCIVTTKQNDLPFQNFQKWAKGIATDCLDKVNKAYYKN